MERDILTLLRTDVVEAAKGLLGCILVRGHLSARIVETEAYRMDEPGCHSFRGQTPRTEVMFGEPGRAYVYFTYGCHWMLNVVAHGPGDGSAILIRAAEPLSGLDEMQARRPRAKRVSDLLSGPGKVAAAFRITAEDNGTNLLTVPSGDLHLEVGEEVTEILVGTRVGLAAGKGDDIPWRFIDANRTQYASKPLPTMRLR